MATEREMELAAVEVAQEHAKVAAHEYYTATRERDDEIDRKVREVRAEVEAAHRDLVRELWTKMDGAQRAVAALAAAHTEKWGEHGFKAGERAFLAEREGGGNWYRRHTTYEKVEVQFAVYTNQLRVRELAANAGVWGVREGMLIWRKVKKDGTVGKKWGKVEGRRLTEYMTEEEWNERYVPQGKSWVVRPDEPVVPVAPVEGVNVSENA